jgi:hypothetical protein
VNSDFGSACTSAGIFTVVSVALWRLVTARMSRGKSGS